MPMAKMYNKQSLNPVRRSDWGAENTAATR
jgi:hypothetical protein